MRTRFLATLCLSVLLSSCSSATDGNQDGGDSAPSSGMDVLLTEFGEVPVGQEVVITCRNELRKTSYPLNEPFVVSGSFHLKHYAAECVTWVSAADSAWVDTLMVGEVRVKSVRLRSIAVGEGELEAFVVVLPGDSLHTDGGSDVTPIYVR